MATAGSRTSSLGGLLDPSSGSGTGTGAQDSPSGSSGTSVSTSSGKAKRSAGESSQWRRKVRSVDLDKCESGSVQSALLQHSLGDRTSSHLGDTNGAQEWMRSPLKSPSSADHGAASAAVDVNASHNNR